jgi:hypothetical protein
LRVIGLGGCYIEAVSPFPAQTKLELRIGAYGIEIRLAGEVRYSQPGFGMGIMFTGVSATDSQALERIIAAASGWK